MTATDDEMQNIDILSIDQGLEPYKEHFNYRIKRYVDQKKLIEKYEGGLEQFAQGDFLLYTLDQCYVINAAACSLRLSVHFGSCIVTYINFLCYVCQRYYSKTCFLLL